MTQFSVVVPIYGVEKYLPQCLDSLIQQTFTDIEIILVDDGSPDNCPRICDEYAARDSRIKVIHKKNGGLVSARQAGAKVATGDYISCVDGDDWVDVKYFEKFAEVVRTYSPDVVRAGFILSSERGEKANPFEERKGFYTRTDIEKEIFPYLIEGESANYFRNNLWGNVFKRELYEEEQFSLDPRIKIGEDAACLKPIIAKANSMYILEDCHYFYRYNYDSMTKNKKPFPWDGPELIGRHLEERLTGTKYDFKYQISRVVTHLIFNVCYTQFYQNKNFIDVTHDIKNNLKNEFYHRHIQNCFFAKTWKGFFAQCALRNKCYFLMWLYSKIK